MLQFKFRALLTTNALTIFALLFLSSCGGKTETTQPPSQVNNAAPRVDARPKIVAFGDSLSAGFGLKSESESYPAQLQKLIDADGFNYQVVNAGVSGDTSAGGVRRIDWSLQSDNGKVEFLILELGANDILRGLPVSEMRKNLAQIIERAKAKNVQVILAGMYSPTTNGAQYQRDVRQTYKSLADEYKLPFIPFILERIAGVDALNQSDNAHPNAEGVRIMAETVYKTLKPLLEKSEGKSPNKK